MLVRKTKIGTLKVVEYKKPNNKKFKNKSFINNSVKAKEFDKKMKSKGYITRFYNIK